MKRLSIFRLTRMLPASIALSGIAALLGCVSPTQVTYYDAGSPSAGRRGSLTSNGGGIVQAGGVIEDGGGYQIRTANAVGDQGGIVQTGGFGGDGSRRGSLIADHGGLVQGGGWVDGSEGGGVRRGSLIGDRGGVVQGGGWTDNSDGGGVRRGSLFGEHAVAQADGISPGGYIDGDAGRRGSIFGDRGTYSDGGCAAGNCGGGRGGLVGGRGGVGLSIDRCAAVPPGALPAQLGGSIRAFHRVQKENADLDKYVIYQNEWYSNGIELGPWGLNHVWLTAKRLCAVNIPVIVQASPDGQLNEIRRQKIVEHLVRLGVTGNVDARVVIGFPEAIGLDGNEAPRIYQQMLTPIQGQNSGFGGSTFGNTNGFNNGGSFGGGFGGTGGFGGGFNRPLGF